MPILAASPLNGGDVADPAGAEAECGAELVPFIVEFIVTFWGMKAAPLLSSRPHWAMGSSGHDGTVHMDCNCGPWALTTVVGGLQR